MKIRRLAATTVAVSVGLALAACSSETPAPEESAGTGEPEAPAITLTEWDYNAPDNSAWPAWPMLEACADEVGVTIDRQGVPGDQLLAKILQGAAAGSLPDLLLLDNPDLAVVAETGALADLSAFGVDTTGFVEPAVAAGTVDGTLYGVAPAMNALALFYNTAIFEEAGLEPPTTWDELLTTAKALSNGTRYGIALSGASGEGGSFSFQPYMWSNGGSMEKLDSPENAEALQLWLDLIATGGASSSALNWNLLDISNQFIEGNAAMMVTGPWALGSLNDAGVEYGIVPIPTPQAGDPVIVPLGGEVWTVPSTDPAKQEAAGRVVACLASDESALTWASLNNYVPSKPDVAAEAIAANPTLEAFAAELPTARPRTAGLGADYTAASKALWTAIQNVLAGVMTPEDALAQAEEEAEAGA